MYKKFDPILHKENDKKAKEVVKRFIKSRGLEVKENSDQYGIDLIANDEKGNKLFIECEIKHLWEYEVFPFEDIQIPYRKEKFISSNMIFFMLNKNCTKGLWIWGEDVALSPIEEVSNKYVLEGEKFFKVPLNKAEIVDINGANNDQGRNSG